MTQVSLGEQMGAQGEFVSVPCRGDGETERPQVPPSTSLLPSPSTGH
jgi:hypothetical protein